MTNVVLSDGKNIELVFKGRVVTEGIDKMMSATKGTEEEGVDGINDFMKFLTSKTAEAAGLTVEQLEDLNDEDREKLVSVLEDRINRRLDFLKSSSRRQG